MNIYIPFTYIIGWSKHKKFYYGAKYAQGCQPSDLWESYFTSSVFVKEFREENGEPDIIKIHREFSDKDSCVSFENKYLSRINAKDNPLFINESNGGKDFNGDGSDWTEKSFEKAKRTWKNNFGYDNPSKSPEIKNKKRQTVFTNWGVEHPTKSDEIKEQIKRTNLQKYGVECVSKLDEVKEKVKRTCIEKYGVDCPTKSPEIQNKTKITNLKKYGFESHNQSSDVKEKKKQSCLEKYGVDHFSKIKKICCYCGELKGMPHEPKCKLNPNRKNKTKN